MGDVTALASNGLGRREEGGGLHGALGAAVSAWGRQGWEREEREKRERGCGKRGAACPGVQRVRWAEWNRECEDPGRVQGDTAPGAHGVTADGITAGQGGRCLLVSRTLRGPAPARTPFAFLSTPPTPFSRLRTL